MTTRVKKVQVNVITRDFSVKYEISVEQTEKCSERFSELPF